MIGFVDLERIRTQIAKGQANPLGMAGVMLEAEARGAHRLIQPGAAAPFDFPADDWAFPQVVTCDGREVRLVLLNARHPGNGAFRRLVAAIQAAGLVPVVIAPVGETMPAILRRWGWKRRLLGQGWEQEEQWRPPARRKA